MSSVSSLLHGKKGITYITLFSLSESKSIGSSYSSFYCSDPAISLENLNQASNSARHNDSSCSCLCTYRSSKFRSKIFVEFSGSCSNSLLDRTIRTLLSGWQVLIKAFHSLASDKCKPKMLYAASLADISEALMNSLSKCCNYLLTEKLPWLISFIASRSSWIYLCSELYNYNRRKHLEWTKHSATYQKTGDEEIFGAFLS